MANREREKALGDDPELLAKATPDYEIGCKRVLLTDDWYPMLRRPDVELVDSAVTRVTPSGVVAADGVERPADVIIHGTGFQTHNFVAPMAIHGLSGRELNEVWAGRAEAFLGTTVSGFPNMFVLYGPNTNHGSGSVPFTLESQFNYIIDAVERLRRGGYRWIDLRPEAQDPLARGDGRAQPRHRLDGRRLSQLVPERRAARTPTTGRVPGWSSAAERAGSTPATTG